MSITARKSPSGKLAGSGKRTPSDQYADHQNVPTQSGTSYRKSKGTHWAPHGIERHPTSSDHVGAQAKRKNQASAGFLATQASLKKTSKTPNIQRKVIT